MCSIFCPLVAQDGTLVTVKSGAQFALRADDWRFFNSSVPEVVRGFHKDGFKVVIFTCAYTCQGFVIKSKPWPALP